MAKRRRKTDRSPSIDTAIERCADTYFEKTPETPYSRHAVEKVLSGARIVRERLGPQELQDFYVMVMEGYGSSRDVVGILVDSGFGIEGVVEGYNPLLQRFADLVHAEAQERYAAKPRKRGRKTPPMTQDEFQLVKRAYERTGMSIADIASFAHVSEGKVRSAVKELVAAPKDPLFIQGGKVSYSRASAIYKNAGPANTVFGTTSQEQSYIKKALDKRAEHEPKIIKALQIMFDDETITTSYRTNK